MTMTRIVCVMTMAVLGLGAAALPAGAAQRELPPSLVLQVQSQATVDTAVMAEVDVNALLAEDAVNDRAPGAGAARFAHAFETGLSSVSNGSWEELDDGSHLWRMRIVSPGALSLNLGLSRLELPSDGRLWIHDGAGELMHGPYTAADRTRSGELWTPMVLGDTLVIEVLARERGGVLVEVGSVNHGYRFFGENRGSAKQGECNIDVICTEGDPWRDQIRAVGVYTRSGAWTCTGTLVNNTAEDFRPYFLTAEHCGITQTNAASIVVYWNYESPVCGQLSGGSLADSTRGATLRAIWENSDFALIELDEQPDASYNAYYAGWDVTGVAPEETVCIHHPSTDEKAISFNDDPVTTVWGTHWLVDAWDLGTTEPGSSGSCLLDRSSQLIVGTLTGGTASCSLPDDPDWFGKLSLSFTGGGSADDSLAPWLDPLSTGAQTLAGRDPADGGDECVPDDDTLCLQGGRFKVEVSWRDAQGNTGTGKKVLDSDDSGLLWFFNQRNWEMLVKVLDGCAINERFWVFASAATDVEYTIEVTDLATGEVKRYTNQQGTASPAITDTAAFATCGPPPPPL